MWPAWAGLQSLGTARYTRWKFTNTVLPAKQGADRSALVKKKNHQLTFFILMLLRSHFHIIILEGFVWIPHSRADFYSNSQLWTGRYILQSFASATPVNSCCCTPVLGNCTSNGYPINAHRFLGLVVQVLRRKSWTSDCQFRKPSSAK